MDLQREVHRSQRRGRRAWWLAALVFGISASAGQAQETKLDLAGLLQIGLERQPSLAAARASAAAAVSAQQGLNSMPLFARFMAPDLPVRKEQSMVGITIAQAGLRQAEWDTRYAITRNYYSVQYARIQEELVANLVKKLEIARKRAIKLVEAGQVKIKVTQLDVDLLTLNIELVKAKQEEARFGKYKAGAALREALGVGMEYPLAKLAPVDLPPLVDKLNKGELISYALSHRGELEQASAARRVTELEVEAQSRICCFPFAKTFAAGGDIHATQVPQGTSNTDYRPGGVALEMPPGLAGKRRERMQRAQDFSDRASAVVDKTQNLISLEVEIVFLKWEENVMRAQSLEKTLKLSADIAEKVQSIFNEGKGSGEEILRARAQEDQIQSLYNEARYLHALALAALERATAGGYRFPVAAAGK